MDTDARGALNGVMKLGILRKFFRSLTESNTHSRVSREGSSRLLSLVFSKSRVMTILTPLYGRRGLPLRKRSGGGGRRLSTSARLLHVASWFLSIVSLCSAARHPSSTSDGPPRLDRDITGDAIESGEDETSVYRSSLAAASEVERSSLETLLFRVSTEAEQSGPSFRKVDSMLPMSWDVPMATRTTIVSRSTVPRRGLRPWTPSYVPMMTLTRAPNEFHDDEDALVLDGGFLQTGWTTWVISVDVCGLTLTFIALVFVTLLSLILLDVCGYGRGDGDTSDAEDRETNCKADKAKEECTQTPL